MDCFDAVVFGGSMQDTSRPEESFLVAQSHTYAEAGVDVALAAIDPPQWHDAVVQYFGSIRARIHEVELREDVDGAFAARI